MIFQRYPKTIEATGILNSDGVDLHMKVKLTYSDIAFATIESSATETLNNQAVIRGSEGEITVSSVDRRPSFTMQFFIEFFVLNLNPATGSGQFHSSNRH